MKLIHTKTNAVVKIGDHVDLGDMPKAEWHTIVSWEEPRTPASTGHITSVRGKLSKPAALRKYALHKCERYYAGVYGCEFVDRTDRS